jgi:hypothetical protein
VLMTREAPRLSDAPALLALPWHLTFDSYTTAAEVTCLVDLSFLFFCCVFNVFSR